MSGIQHVLAVVLLVTSCSSSAETGASRQFDDASVFAGGSGGTGGPGTRDAGSRDGSPIDACDDGVVTNVVRSRAPESSAEAGGPPPIRLVDGGFVFSTPTDPCVTYARPDCLGAPRSIFGCPSVVDANDSGAIHPGDQITVKVPIPDDGLAAYSCEGLATDQDLAGGRALLYAVSPGYAELSGQIPPSTKPGTVYHFTAVASGSRYTSGAACENDLTRLDFDVTVE